MNLKRLVEISPLIGSFLVLMGFFKLYYFYGHWSINIISYLDFSEIVLSFLNDINILIFFTFLLIFQAMLGTGAIVAIDNRIKLKQNQKSSTISENGGDATSIKMQESSSHQGIMPLINENFEKHPNMVVITLIVSILLFVSLFLCFNHWSYLYFCFLFSLYLFFLKKSLELKKVKFCFNYHSL